MPDELGLDDAYSVETPDDNRRLYRSWADTYESGFMLSHGYVYPANVVEVFADNATGDDDPVLDVGCGTGVGAIELSKVGSWTVDGLDITPEMLVQAGTKQGADGPLYRNLIEADLTTRLEIDDGSYGSVISIGTFTHGHVGPEALHELVRILRPNGLLCLGINEIFFEKAGFAAAFQATIESGGITRPRYTRIAMYDAEQGSHEHVGDAAMVAVARRLGAAG